MADDTTPPAAPPVTPPAPAPDKAPDSDGLRSDLKEAIASRDKAKTELRQLREEKDALSSWKSDQEKERQESETAGKQKELEEQQKYAEALTTVKADHADKIGKLQSSIELRLKPSLIKSSAAKIENISPQAMEDLPSILGSQIGINPDTLEAFVKGEDGQPLKDKDLKVVTVDAFINDFVAKREYMRLDNQVQSNGTQPGSGQTGVESFTIEAALASPKIMKEWKERDPEGYARAWKEHLSDPVKLAKSKLKTRMTIT